MALFLTRQSIRTHRMTQSRSPYLHYSTTSPPTEPSSSLPRILQPSLWRLAVPRFLRPASPSPSTTTTTTTTTVHSLWRSPPLDRHTGLASLVRNPAVHITLLAIVCGSQAIHVLAAKQAIADGDAAVRRKVQLLRDVLERIQRGESVDVRAELGTGVESDEKEWEMVVQRLGEAESWVKSGKMGGVERVAGDEEGVKAKTKTKKNAETERSSAAGGNDATKFLDWSAWMEWSGWLSKKSQEKKTPPADIQDQRKPAFF